MLCDAPRMSQSDVSIFPQNTAAQVRNQVRTLPKIWPVSSSSSCRRTMSDLYGVSPSERIRTPATRWSPQCVILPTNLAPFWIYILMVLLRFANSHVQLCCKPPITLGLIATSRALVNCSTYPHGVPPFGVFAPRQCWKYPIAAYNLALAFVPVERSSPPLATPGYYLSWSRSGTTFFVF